MSIARISTHVTSLVKIIFFQGWPARAGLAWRTRELLTLDQVDAILYSTLYFTVYNHFDDAREIIQPTYKPL